MFTTFYYGITKKVVASFGTLFNNIYIVRENKKIRVPLIYSPKEKFIHRLKLDYNKQQFQTVLPKMGFSISGMGYDPERKKNTTNRKIKDVIETSGDVSFKYRYEDVPYSIAFELYSYVRNIDDGLQIFEQIVPFFTPEFTITVKPQILEDSAEEKIDVPIILKQTSLAEMYDGDFNDNSRILNFNMSFEAKIFYPGPIKEAAVIKYIDIDLFDFNQS
jgi:hypothetical protein